VGAKVEKKAQSVIEGKHGSFPPPFLDDCSSLPLEFSFPFLFRSYGALVNVNGVKTNEQNSGSSPEVFVSV